MKKKKSNKYFPYSIIAIAVIALIGYFFVNPIEVPIQRGIIFLHRHADFKVFINGQELDFNKTEFDEQNTFIHLHISNENDDRVIHVEGKEADLGIFFSSLNMSFNKTCFAVDKNTRCNNSEKKLKFLVNGFQNEAFENYIPKDLDRILISYGNETTEEVKKQMDSVTSDACIYSQKCLVPKNTKDIVF